MLKEKERVLKAKFPLLFPLMMYDLGVYGIVYKPYVIE